MKRKTCRMIYVNRALHSQRKNENKISTTKYNMLTFLPLFLIEQFRKYNNIFFLTIALLQQVPDVSPTGRYTTAFPLIIILSISAIKEVFEDLKRRNSDVKINNFEIPVLRGSTWIDCKWKGLCVGDLVHIKNDHLFPADLVMLSSSESNAMAYIETSNLDGETNLKIRQALPATNCLSNNGIQLAAFEAHIECEAPNRHVHHFTGSLSQPYDDQSPYPLGRNDFIKNRPIDLLFSDIEHMLLRGARLKNTAWVIGVVVYTGHDAKLLMNSKPAPLKRSNVDIMTNRQIIILFAILVSIAFISAIGAKIWDIGNLTQAWYLNQQETAVYFFWNLLTFFILYNNLIPISLQVSLEIVRVLQAISINNDLEMYDIESDTPAMARTSNLNEELGQVKYLLTDKTGTLTRNVMVFKKVSIGGIVYGNDKTDSFDDNSLLANLQTHPTSSLIADCLTLMAICHTVIPKRKQNGTVEYQASSPDEVALVKGAASQGFVFTGRSQDSLTIRLNQTDRSFQLLNALEFTSDRRRMSIIVRGPDNRIRLFAKGADSVILTRLTPDMGHLQDAECHLTQFADLGYRTLCLATRDIDEQEYIDWNSAFVKASTAIESRRELIDKEADKLEQRLTLLGVTAIEDELQYGVADTLDTLMKADIKVWMLTGDKRQTAVNIGHSTGLISSRTKLLVVEGESDHDTFEQVSQYSRQVDQRHDVALVIGGHCLNTIISHPKSRNDLASLALLCRTVIFYRTTPMQKAEVAEMLMSNTDETVLAVGDGANDVAMIQTANVGVGIYGYEGLQAASASDYAVAQFRFLSRLLLVHGAWNYHRNAKVILYSFYKNICLYIIEFWFAFSSAWTGQALFERWSIGLFNVIFTAFPPLVLGLIDRLTVSDKTMLEYPQLYRLSQRRLRFSTQEFWTWIGFAVLHSMIIYFLSRQLMSQSVVWANGLTGGLLMLGNVVYTYVVATVCLKALLESDNWSWLVQVPIGGSILLWFIFVVIYSQSWPVISLGADMAGMGGIVFSSVIFWFGLIYVPTTSLIVDFIYKIAKQWYCPSVADNVAKVERNKNVESARRQGKMRGHYAETYTKRSQPSIFPPRLSSTIGCFDTYGSTNVVERMASNNTIETTIADLDTPNAIFSTCDRLPSGFHSIRLLEPNRNWAEIPQRSADSRHS